MKQDSKRETELRQYLLGELSLEGQVSVEQQLFLNSGYAQLAQAVEDDLIDEYVHNDLSATEREKFESHFLGDPERKLDLKIAQALNRYLDPEPVDHKSLPDSSKQAGLSNKKPIHNEHINSVPPSFLRKAVAWSSLAAAFLVLPFVIISIAKLWNPKTGEQAVKPQPVENRTVAGPTPPTINRTSNGGSETVEQRPTTNKSNELKHREQEPPKRRPAPAGFATFTISPGTISRGEGQIDVVRVSSKLAGVILNLPVITSENYDHYRVTLHRGERRIRVWPRMKGEVDEEIGPVVRVEVPTSLLVRKLYEFRLAGLTAEGRSAELTTYPFQVVQE
jgi:hypothetical protein